MLLSNLTVLLVVLAAGVYCKLGKAGKKPELSWPEKYSFEITKYDIGSGLTEDIKIWHTSKASRVEYNDGAVKRFITSPSSSRFGARGYIYEIHPETTSEEHINEMVCHKMRRPKWSSEPTDLLPSVDDFKEVGTEEMKDEICTKFYSESKDDNLSYKATLWAYYNKKVKAWVPVRYELDEYNDDTGMTDRHDLWEFEGFNGEFDEKTVFDAESLCTEVKRDPIRHEPFDEAVVKHLTFVDPDNEEHVNHVFKSFKKNFNKKYEHEAEHKMRKNIFKKNLRLIKSTNSKNLGYKLAVNHFADRTPEEMNRFMGLRRRTEGKKGAPFPYTRNELHSTLSDLPSEYDLRHEGIISPVQNQESCGSCWTFGTTSAVEGALARSNGGNLIRLSNQALVDCAWEFEAAGCDGGTDNAAYEWMMKYGMPTIAEYGTYKNQDGYCHIQNVTKTFKIKGYVDVTPNSESALKVALFKHGPLSVSVHVTPAFSMYESGIFYDFSCEPTMLNHEVTLIGYGEQYGETFWIIKNSWGQNWGIAGFMNIAARDNNCGIMTEPTYVFL